MNCEVYYNHHHTEGLTNILGQFQMSSEHVNIQTTSLDSCEVDSTSVVMIDVILQLHF